MAAGKAGDDGVDALELLEDGFDAPIAASAESDDLIAFRDSFFIVDVLFQFDVFGWGCGLGIRFAGSGCEHSKADQEVSEKSLHTEIGG